MSIYSTEAIKTVEINAKTQNAYRCEFSLSHLDPDTVILPNMRLANVGCTVGAATNYNAMLGAKSIIKSIHLYSGKTKIDGQHDVGRWLAFNQLRNSNELNRSVKQFSDCTQLGYAFNQQGADKEVTVAPALRLPCAVTEAATGKATLQLVDVFPVLRELVVLDPMVFENLRIVVEFQTKSLFVTELFNSVITPLVPILLIDQADRKAAGKNPSVVSWMAIENDRFNIDAVPVPAAPQVTSNTKRLNGFNNKNVNRIVIMTTFTDENKYRETDATDEDVDGIGPYASNAQLQERFQIICNGSNRLPLEGLEGQGGQRKLAKLNDSWGKFNITPFQNGLFLHNLDLVDTAGAGTLSQMDFFGCYLNQKVNSLDITYTRTSIPDGSYHTNYSNALTMIVHGEVPKAIQFGKGGFNVSYL